MVTSATPVRVRLQVDHVFRRTPSLIAAYAVGMAVLLVVTGVVAMLSVDPLTALGRQSATDAANASADARSIYGQLAAVDTAVNKMLFTPATGDTAAADDAYDAANRKLADAIDVAVRHARSSSRIGTIATELQVYQSAVGRARALHRGGTPDVLAAAYAHEASDYLHGTLLVSAQRMWQDESQRVSQARSRGRWWMVGVVGLPLLDLALLILLQRWLARRTHRRLNAGLVVATALVLVVCGLFLVAASTWSTASGRLQATEKAFRAEDATQAQVGRVVAAQAEVYLAMGVGVDTANHEQAFEGLAGCTHPDALYRNLCAHQREAWQTLIALGQSYTTVDGGVVNDDFDSALGTLDDQLRDEDTATADALAAMPAAPPAVGAAAALLALLAALGVVVGLWTRWADYS